MPCAMNERNYFHKFQIEFRLILTVIFDYCKWMRYNSKKFLKKTAPISLNYVTPKVLFQYLRKCRLIDPFSLALLLFVVVADFERRCLQEANSFLFAPHQIFRCPVSLASAIIHRPTAAIIHRPSSPLPVSIRKPIVLDYRSIHKHKWGSSYQV